MLQTDQIKFFVDNYCKLFLCFLAMLFISNNVFPVESLVQRSTHLQTNHVNINFHTLPANFQFRATRSIIRDHKGLMWFGTENGLVRFDGINQKVYEHHSYDLQSIRYNTVNVLFEDKNNKLWIGTSRGLNFYNRKLDVFDIVDSLSQEAELLNQSYISAISATNDSHLWIGTFAQGLFRLDITSQQSKRYQFVSQTGQNINITAIQADGEKHLLIGTQSGLVLFNTETGQHNWYYSDKKNPQSLSNNNITSIQKDKFGSIWIGTEDGGLNLLVKSGNTVYFERFNSRSSRVRVPGNTVKTLLADREGNLWIGTENDGLYLLDIQSGLVQLFTHDDGNSKSIGSNSIWSIYQDKEGRVWIGSYNKGISVYDAYYSKFEGFHVNPYSPNSLVNNDVRGFCDDSDGRIWIATDGGGICRFNLANHTYDQFINAQSKSKPLTSNSIQSIISDSDGNIWLGSWGGGVDRLDANGSFIKNYKVENKVGVGNNKVRSIYRDHTGNIWVCTNGSGLFVYNKSRDEFLSVSYPDLLNQGSYISAISVGKEREIWVGTLTGLLSLKVDGQNHIIDAKRFTTENSQLSSDAINSLIIDSEHNIWIGTANGGLNVLNPANGSFRIIRKNEGLSSNNVSAIVEDNDGNIWISTNNGISKINRNTLEITNFSMADGLNSNEFYSKSCFKTKNGSLLFGSGKGFNLIRPEKIRKNSHIPNILLTELKINNLPVSVSMEASPLKKQFSETDTLILNYQQSSFSIDFVALNYTRPNQNQFAYQLVGFDNDWNYIGSKTTAYYTKVKPGKFVFKVKGSNNDGIWNEDPSSLIIVIKPPFWKTKWAYIAYLLLFFTVMIILFTIWQERIHMNNQLELEKLAKQREHEMNIRNLEFFTNISHEFRTPLSLIIGPIESLIDSAPAKMHAQLKAIQRNSQRLLSLTNNLLDLRKLEDGRMKLHICEVDIVKSTESIIEYFSLMLKKQRINFSVIFLKDETVFYFDNEKYTTILTNLLSNALKYTPQNGTIRIAVMHQLLDNQLEISITNTGVGIHPSDLPFVFDRFYQANTKSQQKQFGTGIGLSLCKGLVELHGGKIWVNSTPDQETTFAFTIPVNKPADHLIEIYAERSELYLPDTYIDDYNENESATNLTEKDEDLPLVLIVEDNNDLRLFLKTELEKSYNIALASNGDEGLRKANDLIPDLIISDVVMPIMNGFELCKAIKADVRTSHIPLVMLTAKTTTNEQIEGLNTGADAYISKPFHLKLLQTQIAKLIQSRKDLYARFSQDVYIMARKQSGNELDQAFLQKTIDYIIDNITDSKLSIESLSEWHNMSHRNFYRKLKALTGNTVVEFIKIVRLKQALKLMETQQHNLSEISYLTGFTSPSYFTKNFREFYGKPPSDYLKN